MPAILALISSIFSRPVLIPLLRRVGAIIGIQAITYVGFGALLQGVTEHVISSYSGLSADMLAVFAIGQVPQAISVILSAYATRLTVSGLTAAGSLRKVLWKPGQQGELF